MSFCKLTIMSTRRRQAFFMKARAVEVASLDVLRAVSGGAVRHFAGGTGVGARRRRQRGRRSLLRNRSDLLLQLGDFVLQPRDLLSSAARSSGTAWQAQPTLCGLQSATWPVCVVEPKEAVVDAVEGIAAASATAARRLAGAGGLPASGGAARCAGTASRPGQRGQRHAGVTASKRDIAAVRVRMRESPGGETNTGIAARVPD